MPGKSMIPANPSFFFKVLFACFCLGFSVPSFSQSIYFQTVFGGPDTEIGRAIREFPDGSLYLAGFRDNGPKGGYDFSLSKLDSTGNLIWTNYFGTAQDDNCLSMTKSRDGNLLLVGETQSVNNGLDGFIIKIDPAGNEIWRKFISTALNESLRSISETADSGFVMSGYQNDALGSNDSWFVKIDKTGEVVWDQAYGGSDTEYADGIEELPNGRLIATGDTKSSGNGGYDVQLFYMDDAGIPVWDMTYGDQFQNGCQGVKILSDGTFLSYGETEIFQNSPYEIYLEKIDSTGASKWRKTFGGNGTDAAFSVAELNDGSLMLTGYTNSVVSGPLSLAVAKADTGGNMIWLRSYGGPGIDIGYDIQPSSRGGFIIAGRIFEDDSDQYFVLHVNNEGLISSREDETSNHHLTVYPNPANETFSIDAIDVLNTNIYDINGRLVKTEPVQKNFSVSDFPEGVYLLEIQTRESVFRQKLIVSH